MRCAHASQLPVSHPWQAVWLRLGWGRAEEEKVTWHVRPQGQKREEVEVHSDIVRIRHQNAVAARALQAATRMDNR